MIVSTAWSFAALADGILVTWGDPRCGGDSRMVQEQLGGKVMLGGFLVRWRIPRSFFLRLRKPQALPILLVTFLGWLRGDPFSMVN